MKEKSRCSILFHLLVPGGRWLTTMSRPSSLASLQFAFPQPHPPAVAAAAVRGDQQAGGVGVTRLPEVEPPLADAVDREGSGPAQPSRTAVVRDPYARWCGRACNI